MKGERSMEKTVVVLKVSNGFLLQLHVGGEPVREAVHNGNGVGLGEAINSLFAYRIRGKKKGVPGEGG